MNKKILYSICLLNAMLLSSGCAYQSFDLPQHSSIHFEETSLEAGDMQSDNGFAPLPNENNGISVYENQELGLEINYIPGSQGNYIITRGSQSQEYNIGYEPDAVESLTITPWDSNSLFLVCHLTFADKKCQRYIINSEMLSEIMIYDPLETAKARISREIIENNGSLCLYINQESTGIFADQRETLEMLGHNIRPLNDILFHSEDGSFLCDVPLAIYENEKIGFIRLYYEFEGVGMNCINAEFLPPN